MERPTTIGELKQSGYQPRTVKNELRANLIKKITKGESLFPGIIGYDDTVIPEIENAILSGHDIILLGERGQAKTRIMRALVHLLDDFLPVISGCEINDNPLHPLCKRCRELVKEEGERTKLAWLSPHQRFAEKLATPDVTIADLIGDLDPAKIAEGRSLSDELAIHYGLIPRTNRGIFSINELPDLHEKIQVGLFNLLEERDVQIRGYKIALPLDLFIIATANPEDYTSRGRIITPLKDRFGAQIRTHYPRTLEEEIAIVRQERSPFAGGRHKLIIPYFMEEIIVEISQMARRRSDVNHSSGISVRMSLHNMENLISNAFRRALRLKEDEVVPRISDLNHLSSSMKGKIEWNFIEEGTEEERIALLIRDAISKIFRRYFSYDSFAPFLNEFSKGSGCEVYEMMPSSLYLALINSYPSLKEHLVHISGSFSPGESAAALEFILEGLACGGRIKKEIREMGMFYTVKD